MSENQVANHFSILEDDAMGELGKLLKLMMHSKTNMHWLLLRIRSHDLQTLQTILQEICFRHILPSTK